MGIVLIYCGLSSFQGLYRVMICLTEDYTLSKPSALYFVHDSHLSRLIIPRDLYLLSSTAVHSVSDDGSTTIAANARYKLIICRIVKV